MNLRNRRHRHEASTKIILRVFARPARLYLPACKNSFKKHVLRYTGPMAAGLEFNVAKITTQ